ncbi:hypothetical protein AAF712_008580 [Marasmius tenuissimus]|uniref:Uncharacterized protein n=1 Tax=Marasmius tenuissimus TaxID=585030 RepID=A0ABR2ZTX4_9AGAR
MDPLSGFLSRLLDIIAPYPWLSQTQDNEDPPSPTPHTFIPTITAERFTQQDIVVPTNLSYRGFIRILVRHRAPVTDGVVQETLVVPLRRLEEIATRFQELRTEDSTATWEQFAQLELEWFKGWIDFDNILNYVILSIVDHVVLQMPPSLFEARHVLPGVHRLALIKHQSSLSLQSYTGITSDDYYSRLHLDRDSSRQFLDNPPPRIPAVMDWLQRSAHRAYRNPSPRLLLSIPQGATTLPKPVLVTPTPLKLSTSIPPSTNPSTSSTRPRPVTVSTLPTASRARPPPKIPTMKPSNSSTQSASVILAMRPSNPPRRQNTRVVTEPTRSTHVIDVDALPSPEIIDVDDFSIPEPIEVDDTPSPEPPAIFPHLPAGDVSTLPVRRPLKRVVMDCVLVPPYPSQAVKQEPVAPSTNAPPPASQLGPSLAPSSIPARLNERIPRHTYRTVPGRLRGQLRTQAGARLIQRCSAGTTTASQATQDPPLVPLPDGFVPPPPSSELPPRKKQKSKHDVDTNEEGKGKGKGKQRQGDDKPKRIPKLRWSSERHQRFMAVPLEKRFPIDVPNPIFVSDPLDRVLQVLTTSSLIVPSPRIDIIKAVSARNARTPAITRPLEHFRSVTPVRLPPAQHVQRPKNQFDYPRVAGTIFMMPRKSCQACVKQGHPCLQDRDSVVKGRTWGCLSCRWSYPGSCELAAGEDPQYRPYLFDGFTFLPFHHDRPFLSPVDLNIYRASHRFDYLATGTEDHSVQPVPENPDRMNKNLAREREGFDQTEGTLVGDSEEDDDADV